MGVYSGCGVTVASMLWEHVAGVQFPPSRLTLRDLSSRGLGYFNVVYLSVSLDPVICLVGKCRDVMSS